MNYVVIIPARYESTRLPGKPLIDLCGIPMIVRTYNQCIKACNKELVYVATDDDRIVDICNKHNIQTIDTPKNCLTGTDRVASCIKTIDADVYINVQGDEPLFNPEDITKIIEKSKENPDNIISGFASISDENQFRSFSTPKVVINSNKKLLYMSRSPIPISKSNNFHSAYRQICAYAFPKEPLLNFYNHGLKTPLEAIEDIEILRFLELGYEVDMVELSEVSVPVDNPEDVEKIKELLK